MESPTPRAGLDLEKELTCSICTELLYHPLTLLDCLHTFCGACLKEWFSFQAATAERSPNPPASGTNIHTCPSCRASVRDTRPNATFVTLLEMFVISNPDRDRSQAEKDEMDGKYRPGEPVLPRRQARSAEERRNDDDDRRLVEQVRDMSLREVGVSSSVPPRTRRRRDSRSGDERPSGRERSLDGRPRRTAAVHSESERRHRRSEDRQRQIEHQSSIRSLISSQDMSERDIEREIEDFARQIQEEGLLDGLDLDNIDLSRDDELSRRITEAYRRRQRDRDRERDRARHEAARRNGGQGGSSRQQQPENTSTLGAESRRLVPEGNSRPSSRTRPHSRSASATSQTEERSRPPPSSSAAAALDAHDQGRRRRRASSGARSATTPAFRPTGDTGSAAQSATDLTLRSQTSDPTAPRSSFSESRTQTPPTQSPTTFESAVPSGLSFANRAPQGQGHLQGGTSAPATTHPDSSAGTGRGARSNRPSELSLVHSAVSSPMSSPTAPGAQRTRAQLYPEPSVSCSRCQKPHIEYELHYTCSICNSGQWHLCLDCYRGGKGCLSWFGFGHAAWSKWEKKRQQGDGSLARPHILHPRRYLPPRSTPGGADGRKTLTMEDPHNRLETGTFCARCLVCTNECYWRCDACNDGEWGFCNDCVNQGRSCTHTLIPLAYEGNLSASGRPVSPRSPGRPPAATVLTGPNAGNLGAFKALTFSTKCDICHDAIPSVQARYHCYSCTSSLVPNATPGDYDICSDCYGQLVESRRISSENGHAGWRRCPNGHRMVVVGFTDGKVGRWRYIARDLVGGRGLRSEPSGNTEYQSQGLQKWMWQQGDQMVARLVTKDVSQTAPDEDDTSSAPLVRSFPPEGGVGMRGNACWWWYPKAGAEDELLFPRGAEIKEIEDVNGDWFHGTYMGARGLFPAPYVRLDQGAK